MQLVLETGALRPDKSPAAAHWLACMAWALPRLMQASPRSAASRDARQAALLPVPLAAKLASKLLQNKAKLVGLLGSLDALRLADLLAAACPPQGAHGRHCWRFPRRWALHGPNLLPCFDAAPGPRPPGVLHFFGQHSVC